MNGKVLAVVLVAAGLAGAAGYHFYTQRQAPAVPALAPSSAPAAPAQLAATVPHFQLADREGELRSLQDWSGRSLIVNFWATWCAPCRREIPLLQQVARENAADGFEVIGIAVDFRDQVLAYADEMGIEYPLLIGEQDALDAAAAFGIEAIGFPFTIFTDAQGRVVAAHMGELTADEADLILTAVRRVNAGESDPAAARAEIAAGISALQHAEAGKSAG
jgi:thiol-disulfide isomerase/thioredoxin